MDLAARPHITAGVALASAAVIAAGPIAQHLPDFHLTRHLPEVSVSDISLTDAATSTVDLFGGVQSQLASLANGAAAAALPAPPTGLPLPVQTWVDTFATAGTNLQKLYNGWNPPAALLQQFAANLVEYGNIYVGAYQTAAQDSINYIFGAKASDLGPLLHTAFTDLISGNVQTGLNDLWTALYSNTFTNILYPLEAILKIPVDITQNLANATDSLLTGGVTELGSLALGFPTYLEEAFSKGAQAVVTSWDSGNYLGAATNLLNIPGAVAYQFLNGTIAKYPSYGLLTQNFGVLNTLSIQIPQQLANSIVAPNATNIMSGGSLSAAFQQLVNTFLNGWPSLSPVIGSISNGLTSLLQSVPSVVSNLPSILGNLAGTVATQIGSWIAALLKLL
ncbi:hypothetical protein [Mycobacterium malmoense]|uniref:hypothetical protein n=1 Tax=Mycobacterium malmoense TaxID=1780 RepID=UPI00111C4B97|nr:hypothetical protein [Mycobacterium malmoense]UNB93317.1 hypothetical protein H5T25_17825 [Mycobacterium malmoense]